MAERIVRVQFTVDGQVKKAVAFIKGEQFSRVHVDLHMLLLQLLDDLAEEGTIEREGG